MGQDRNSWDTGACFTPSQVPLHRTTVWPGGAGEPWRLRGCRGRCHAAVSGNVAKAVSLAEIHHPPKGTDKKTYLRGCRRTVVSPEARQCLTHPKCLAGLSSHGWDLRWLAGRWAKPGTAWTRHPPWALLSCTAEVTKCLQDRCQVWPQHHWGFSLPPCTATLPNFMLSRKFLFSFLPFLGIYLTMKSVTFTCKLLEDRLGLMDKALPSSLTPLCFCPVSGAAPLGQQPGSWLPLKAIVFPYLKL